MNLLPHKIMKLSLTSQANIGLLNLDKKKFCLFFKSIKHIVLSSLFPMLKIYSSFLINNILSIPPLCTL